MPQPSDNIDMDSIMAGIVQNKHVPSKPSPAPNMIKVTDSAPEKTPRLRPWKTLLLVSGMLIVVSAAFWLLASTAQGSLFSPPSPFTAEQKNNMGAPLFYPTKMPGTFKIEIDDTNKKADNGVFMYVISNDDGKFVTINQQSTPQEVNIDDLFSGLSDTRDIRTPIGTAKSGLDEETSKVITYLSTDKTWIIISMDKDTLTSDELDLLLSSIKEG